MKELSQDCRRPSVADEMAWLRQEVERLSAWKIAAENPKGASGGEGAKVPRYAALKEMVFELRTALSIGDAHGGVERVNTVFGAIEELAFNMADHDAAIANKDARIERLVAEINDLQKERTDTEIKNDAAIAAKDSVIERAKRGIVSLREQYASVSELLTRVSDERDELRQRAERAEAELAEARQECERLRANWLSEQRQRLAVADLVEMYSAVKAKKEIEQLRTQLAAATKELNWYIDESRAFNDRLRDLGHEPGGLTIDHIWVCGEVKKMREKLAAVEKERDDLQATFTKANVLGWEGQTPTLKILADQLVAQRDAAWRSQEACADANNKYLTDNYNLTQANAAITKECEGLRELLREALPIVNKYRAARDPTLTYLVDKIDQALSATRGV